jgi:hypothetical protein
MLKIEPAGLYYKFDIHLFNIHIYMHVTQYYYVQHIMLHVIIDIDLDRLMYVAIHLFVHVLRFVCNSVSSMFKMLYLYTLQLVEMLCYCFIESHKVS